MLHNIKLSEVFLIWISLPSLIGCLKWLKLSLWITRRGFEPGWCLLHSNILEQDRNSTLLPELTLKTTCVRKESRQWMIILALNPMGTVNRSPKQTVPVAPQNGDVLPQKHFENKNAFQSKAHLPLANRNSNTYNLTLVWAWPGLWSWHRISQTK